MTDDEIDTIWWMAGRMKPWEFRKYMRVVFASIADTAGAKLSASNLPEEFRIKDPADYKRTMDTQFATVAVVTVPPFEDERVQLVYGLICDTEVVPPAGEHWDGFVSRRIVAALELHAKLSNASIADTAGANQEIKVAYQEGHFQGHHDGMKAAEDILLDRLKNGEDYTTPLLTSEGRAEPVAWLHTMHMEGGQTDERLSFSDENPWGKPGFDYSEEYAVVSKPLVFPSAISKEK